MAFIYEPVGRAKEYSPWAINLAVGCAHGCKYCYAPGCYKLSQAEYFKGGVVKSGILSSIDKELGRIKKKLKPGERVLFCFTSDPYQNSEIGKVTGSLLRRFRAFDVPFQVLTKGGMRASRDFELYTKQDAFGTTLTFFEESKSREIEPGAADPVDRLKALKVANDLGISTWVSFEPVLDEEEVVRLYEASKGFVDLFKVGKVSKFQSSVRDWKAFGNRMISMFKKDGKAFYIKEDLRKCLV